MKKKQIAITLGIMCFGLTLAISIQLRTVKNSNTTISQSLKENGLRDEVLTWKEKYDNSYSELTGTTKELEEIRKQATQNDGAAQAKQQEIMQNDMLLGMVDVVGPGIEINLIENNPSLSSESKEFLDLNLFVVHQRDLQQIVNALNNAGAEAISINRTKNCTNVRYYLRRKCN